MNRMLTQRHTGHHPIQGFTLVEMMVALVISLILLAGVSQIFLGSRKSFTVQDTLARQQENGRYAIDVVAEDLRRAGYWGGNADPEGILGTLGPADPGLAGTCATGDDTWGRLLNRRLFGLNDSDAANIAAYACIQDGNGYLSGDVLVVRYAAPWVVGSLTTPNFESNRVYLRNGLFDGHIFKGIDEADTANQVNTSATPTERTSELIAHAYYIGPSGQECNGIAVPSLWRETLGTTGQPVAEEVAYGVDQLQVRYGVDTDISPVDFDGDGSIDQYFDAQNVPDWSQVVSARVWLLTRAECPETGYTNTSTYEMGDLTGGTVYAPNDAFRRQLYEITVSLRNR